ncbi:MAG: M20/M25/M40 family metallo-hydrolase [Oligoflexales bacterium]
MKCFIFLFFFLVLLGSSSLSFSKISSFSSVDQGHGIATVLNGHTIYYSSPKTMLHADTEKMIYIVRSEQRSEREDSLFSLYDELETQFHFLLLSPSERDALALQHGGKGCGHLQLLDGGFEHSGAVAQELYSLEHNLPGLATLLKSVDYSKIVDTISVLERLSTRFHTSENGLATPQLIYDRIRSLDDDIEVRLVQHKYTDQKSVIVKIRGVTSPDQSMIFGSHIDSINSHGGSAPGADDDASGVAVLIEMIRVILEKKVQFHKTIEWHFYAAEEIGLVGSSQIAQEYAQKGTDVLGMVQFDMLAWSPDAKIFLIETDTDDSLTRGLGKLLSRYHIAEYEFAKLSAGTSDHKSWSSRGYPVAFPFENPVDFNPGWHSEDDTSEKMLNPQISSRYAQLALATGSHYAGIVLTPPVSLSKDLFFAATSEAFLVSVSSSAHSVYACLSQDGVSCQPKYVKFDFLKNNANRKVYYSQATDMVIGQKWLIWALSEKEENISSRWIQLFEKH